MSRSHSQAQLLNLPRPRTLPKRRIRTFKSLYRIIDMLQRRFPCAFWITRGNGRVHGKVLGPDGLGQVSAPRFVGACDADRLFDELRDELVQ